MFRDCLWFPLIKLAKKLKESRQQFCEKTGWKKFPLIKLAKKLKEDKRTNQMNYPEYPLFPLIKLAKKLKVKLKDWRLFAHSSFH